MPISLRVPVQWRLKRFIQDHGLSVYAVSKHTRGRLSRNALYSLVGGSPPKRLELKTFDVLIPVLRNLTGVDVRVAELLEWVEDETGSS